MTKATKVRNVVIVLAVLVTLLSALALYWIPSFVKSVNTPVSSTQEKSTASTPSLSVSPIVNINVHGDYPDGGDGFYSPVTVTVVIGVNNTVSWMNDGRAIHTVTDSPAFDSGDLNPGQTWQYTFTKAGTYPYFCIYHPQMLGTVIVKNQSP